MIVNLWQIEDRGKSILFSRVPPERYRGKEDEIFIGRSIIEHISRYALDKGMRMCEVDIPEWLVIKENL